MQARSIKNVLFVAVMAAAFAGCTSAKTKESLDQQVKAEPNNQKQSDITSTVDSKLLSNPKLSDEQKSQLRALHATTHEEYSKVHNELRQTQSLLIKKLADPNAKITEVDYLKRKIKDLDHKQLDIGFKALDKAEIIVGKTTAMDEDFYQHFLRDDGDVEMNHMQPQ